LRNQARRAPLSYYPFFHGPLAALRANVDDLAVRYGRDIFVAESQ
jgi:arabinogalactan endo-1,4-beta-galactosidase